VNSTRIVACVVVYATMHSTSWIALIKYGVNDIIVATRTC
jgi:hypothetical protein